MRHFITILLLAFTVNACVIRQNPNDDSDVASPMARPKVNPLIEALGLFTGTTKTHPPTVFERLKDYEQSAPKADKPLVAKLLPIVSVYLQSPNNLNQSHYRRLISIMADLSNIYPDQFSTRIAMAEGIFSLSLLAKSQSTESENVDKSLQERAALEAESLVTSFPEEAKARELLGNVLVASSADDLQILQQYGRCMTLDQKNSRCAAAFRHHAESYTRPHCREINKTALSFHAAYTEPNKERTQVAAGAEKIYMEKKTVVSSADFDEVIEQTARENELPFLTAWLNPAATATLAEVTEKLAEAKGYLIVQKKGKVIATPRVMSRIDNGQIQIAAINLKLSDLCSKIERKKLPPELAKLLR